MDARLKIDRVSRIRVNVHGCLRLAGCTALALAVGRPYRLCSWRPVGWEPTPHPIPQYGMAPRGAAMSSLIISMMTRGRGLAHAGEASTHWPVHCVRGTTCRPTGRYPRVHSMASPCPGLPTTCHLW
jgi:hypothetical protein